MTLDALMALKAKLIVYLCILSLLCHSSIKEVCLFLLEYKDDELITP